MLTPSHFIDCHCHLFNIEDIPLYPTLSGYLPSRCLLMLATVFFNPKSELRKSRPFIDYMDMRRNESTLWLVSQIKNSLVILPSGIPKNRIITPLVMDFDKIDYTPSLSKFDPKVQDVIAQTKSLINGIKTAEETDGWPGMAAKVLPFIGVDLRKFELPEDVERAFDSLLDQCGGMKSKSDRKNPDFLCNGDIIGIKLYPPIGFNPFSRVSGSSNQIFDPCFKRFYQICIDRDIPITVHCQSASGSYHAGDVSEKTADALVHARNWENVMTDPDMKTLRINFAHFGGEETIAQDVFPQPIQTPRRLDAVLLQEPRDCLPLESWTRALVRLLKMHKNTFADLAAFNYANWKGCLALAWLLVLDESDQLNGRVGLSESEGRFKLKDKLLWGSDVPMILGESEDGNGRVETYDAFLQDFLRWTDMTNLDGHRLYKVPSLCRSLTIPNREELIANLTCHNPLRFLFGTNE
jgi:hypothetical protein